MPSENYVDLLPWANPASWGVTELRGAYLAGAKVRGHGKCSAADANMGRPRVRRCAREIAEIAGNYLIFKLD